MDVEVFKKNNECSPLGIEKNNEYTSDRHKGRQSGEIEQLNSGRGETGDKIVVENTGILSKYVHEMQ